MFRVRIRVRLRVRDRVEPDFHHHVPHHNTMFCKDFYTSKVTMHKKSMFHTVT